MICLSGGANVSGRKLFDWETFIAGMDDFCYIAHLLDRVLVGRKDDGSYRQLHEGVRDDTVLEIRVFNKDEERYAAREGDRMVMYEPLNHEEGRGNDRFYALEEGLGYSTLHVKEYLAIDEDDHAYVAKRVLYELKSKEDHRGESER
jgi:hypothetical protein